MSGKWKILGNGKYTHTILQKHELRSIVPGPKDSSYTENA